MKRIRMKRNSIRSVVVRTLRAERRRRSDRCQSTRGAPNSPVYSAPGLRGQFVRRERMTLWGWLSIVIASSCGGLVVPAHADIPSLSSMGLLGEPEISDVHRAVIDRARLTSVEEATTASRWAHALPVDLRVSVGRDDETDWIRTHTEEDLWRHRRSTEDRIRWRFELRWDLSRLVYTPDWIRLERLRRSAAQQRDRQLEIANRVYYARRRLQLAYLMTPDQQAAQRLELWIQIGEHTAQLDVLTGGLFRRAAVRWWVAGSEERSAHYGSVRAGSPSAVASGSALEEESVPSSSASN